MQREVGQSDYVQLSSRYATRGVFNHSHFFVELGRLAREGNIRRLTRENAAYIQQRAADAEYFRNSKNSKNLNRGLDLAKWGISKDYRNEVHDYDYYDNGGTGGGIMAS